MAFPPHEDGGTHYWPQARHRWLVRCRISQECARTLIFPGTVGGAHIVVILPRPQPKAHQFPAVAFRRLRPPSRYSRCSASPFTCDPADNISYYIAYNRGSILGWHENTEAPLLQPAPPAATPLRRRGG